MDRPYFDFKTKWLGKRVNYDKVLGYQCVDLFKQYMDEVLGIKLKASGNANQIWKNTFNPFDSSWTKITGVNDLMQGDVICSAPGKYGHIAIVDCAGKNMIYVLEQNGSGKGSGSGIGANAIRVQGYRPSFWTGVRRCKKIFNNLEIERTFHSQTLESIRYLVK